MWCVKQNMLHVMIDCGEYFRRCMETELDCQCVFMNKKVKKGILQRCYCVLQFPDCEITLELRYTMPPCSYIYQKFGICSIKTNKGYKKFQSCKFCKEIIDKKYVSYNGEFGLCNTKKGTKYHKKLAKLIKGACKTEDRIHSKLFTLSPNNLMYKCYRLEYTNIVTMILVACKNKDGILGLLPKDIIKLVIKEYYNIMNKILDDECFCD